MPDTYDTQDVFIDREGMWHVSGRPKDPERILRNLDFVANALHGEYGEDGTATSIIEAHGLPHSGHSLFAHALTFHKHKTKDFLNGHFVPRAHHVLVSAEDLPQAAVRAFREIPMPAVVKPSSSAHSFGVSLVRSFGELERAVARALTFADSVLVEEYIPGIEVSCGIIRGFRGEELYAMLPTEMERPEGMVFSANKHAGDLRKWNPARIGKEVKAGIQDLARKVHDALHLGPYSKSDFVVHPKRGVIFLEVNTLPSLARHSEFVHGLEGVGTTLPQFVDHVIKISSR